MVARGPPDPPDPPIPPLDAGLSRLDAFRRGSYVAGGPLATNKPCEAVAATGGLDKARGSGRAGVRHKKRCLVRCRLGDGLSHGQGSSEGSSAGGGWGWRPRAREQPPADGAAAGASKNSGSWLRISIFGTDGAAWAARAVRVVCLDRGEGTAGFEGCGLRGGRHSGIRTCGQRLQGIYVLAGGRPQ
jgi:hypothetical protein